MENDATWHGEHAGNHVTVQIVALNGDEAELCWSDGVIYDEEHTLRRVTP